MFGEDVVSDAVRFAKAVATNVYAWAAPQSYVRFSGQTGRGEQESESIEEIADYFQQSFEELFAKLGVAPENAPQYLKDKVLLEYGPGDLPGVAFLLCAFGASKVYCVDQFPLLTLSEKNTRVLETLVRRLSAAGTNIAGLFNREGDVASGLRRQRIEYLVRPLGTSGLHGEVDLVYSRAVLEHVGDLSATFRDMRRALKPGGKAVHKVDLKSHRLHRRNPLDFLTWPASLWTLMYSHKGLPNRWRVDRYRSLVAELGFESVELEPCELADDKDVEEVRPHLAKPFRNVPTDDLRWLSFWLSMTKPRSQAS